MLFPTIEFAIFFVVVLTTSWFLMPRRLRWKLFMLTASYVFYGWWNARYVLLLVGVTLINHFGATAISRMRAGRGRRLVLAATITADLSILAYFKYYGFFVSSLTNALRSIGVEPPLPLLQIVLPVGVSFFTFQAISYVVDVHRGDTRAVPLLDTAVYLSFFPQLVAGPIVRARELVPQLRRPQDPRNVDAGRGFWLIAAGMFKKVVIANLLATELVDRVFANPDRFNAVELWLAMYGYAVQIYADFSGYTDIAIGVALLLGFTFPDNFDRPYAAVTLQEFWRRWHMTLSRWLRDYLYIPLGGSHGSKLATERNLMITMLLGGLWHGAAWNFVFWGAVHGGWQVLERRGVLFGGYAPPTRRDRVLRALITFHVVCFAWIFFRAESFGRAWTFLGRMVTGWTSAPALDPGVPVWWLVVAIVVPLIAQLTPGDIGERFMALFSRRSALFQGVALAGFLVVVETLGPVGVAPFIYFQF
ncbi:MBOAT family O-acyltransferase [Euzebya tangerina]|uniref:MBOAT family O-acyltransferase n=1 Tax=Euzebya tangerina TaxID=591198 RepID=UPI000E3234B2|nr:MBOAT family protein [Euzebya tangerina]